MLFPSHSITPCGEINSLAPCEGKQFPGNLEDETGMQSLFALSQHQPYGESLPYNTQKKRRLCRRFQSVPHCSTPKLFSIRCSLFTAPNSRFRALKKNREDFTISHLIKRRGRLWGKPLVPTTFERSGIPSAALSQRLKVAVWKSFLHAGDTSPGWAVPCGLPPQSGPAVLAV